MIIEDDEEDNRNLNGVAVPHRAGCAATAECKSTAIFHSLLGESAAMRFWNMNRLDPIHLKSTKTSTRK
jgi:hypothetical protein